MSNAASNAIFLHCLPAKRGYEVSDEVVDGPQSRGGSKPPTACTPPAAMLASCWVFR